jgi:hypothetical protein
MLLINCQFSVGFVTVFDPKPEDQPMDMIEFSLAERIERLSIWDTNGI